MEKLKPIKQFKKDVKKGDLVRIVDTNLLEETPEGWEMVGFFQKSIEVSQRWIQLYLSMTNNPSRHRDLFGIHVYQGEDKKLKKQSPNYYEILRRAP